MTAITTQIEAAIEAADAAIAEFPYHGQASTSERGRFIPPNYSDRGNRAVCTCGFERSGRNAFVSLGVHRQAANKKRHAAVEGLWNKTYDAAMGR